MSGATPSAAPDDDHIGIGALARAAGVPVETLRTWERRYGVPEPSRTATGHRLYPVVAIEHIRLISAAIDAGHRAAQATRLSLPALRALLSTPSSPATGVSATREQSAATLFPLEPSQAPSIAGADGALFDRVLHLDAYGLGLELERELRSRGLLAFLDSVLTPLLVEVGEAWARGAITEAHEHVASERIRDLLAGVVLAYSPGPGAASVIFAGLPGDHHSLGLHMAAAAATLAGVRIVLVGANTPLPAMVSATREVHVQALVVSVSAAFDPGGARQILVDLRRALDRGVVLLVGGAGVPEHVTGVTYPGALPGLVDALASLRGPG